MLGRKNSPCCEGSKSSTWLHPSISTERIDEYGSDTAMDQRDLARIHAKGKEPSCAYDDKTLDLPVILLS